MAEQSKKEYPSIDRLRNEFGRNKKYPSEFEEVILKALSHYPELKEVNIEFRLKDSHAVPYGTSPAFSDVLRSPAKRRYVISLLDAADHPFKMALFRNLPEEAQRAVIGHELGHVVQFVQTNPAGLAGIALAYTNLKGRRKLERGADILAIEHGLGFELYVHAVFIRRIPGYVDKRKEIDTDYLKPQEILDTLPVPTASAV